MSMYQPTQLGFASEQQAKDYAAGAGFVVENDVIPRAHRADVEFSYRLLLSDDGLFYWEAET